MAVVTPSCRRRGATWSSSCSLFAIAVAEAAYAIVGLTVQGAVPQDWWLVGGGFALIVLAVHAVLRWRARYADPVILPIATVLNGLGLVMIHRLDLAHHFNRSTSLATRQLAWSAIGVACAIAVIVYVRDHRSLARYTYTAMIVGFGLLLLPLLPGLGQDISGARIWIALGPLSFQPGEIAKICLALFFAGYLVTARDSLSLVGRRFARPAAAPRPRPRADPRRLGWPASASSSSSSDLGTSLLFFGLFVAMLYVATERHQLDRHRPAALRRRRVRSRGRSSATCRCGSTSGCTRSTPGDIAAAATSWSRACSAWPAAACSAPASARAGRDLVPFAQSDFIVAAFGEELGLAGVFALLVLYGMLVERGLRTAIGVRDGFGKLLAAGLAFAIALQVFVVVGGVTRLIPLTGLTMPFLALRRVVAGRELDRRRPAAAHLRQRPPAGPESVAPSTTAPRSTEVVAGMNAPCAGSRSSSP